MKSKPFTLQPFASTTEARDWRLVQWMRYGGPPAPYSVLVRLKAGVREVSFHAGATYYGRFREPEPQAKA